MRSMRRLFFAATAAALIAGCGPKSNESAQSPAPVDNTGTAPDTAAVVGWLDQLRVAEAGMATAAEQGRLDQVHDHIGKASSLLAGAAAANPDLTPEQKASLDQHAGAASLVADEVHAAADAGDLPKATAKIAEFRAHVRQIENVFSPPAP